MTTRDDMQLLYAMRAARASGRHVPSIEAAFRAVRREDFLGPGPWLVGSSAQAIETPSSDPSLIYQNMLVALDRDRGLNNGEPFLHAQMLAEMGDVTGKNVVHIGCGSGYYTAILAELVGADGSVVGLEVHETLCARAQEALKTNQNTTILRRSGAEYCPSADVIYANAGATRPLDLWLDALRDGGQLIFPLTGSGGWGVMMRIRKDAATWPAKVLCRVNFFDMVGARTESGAQAIDTAFRRTSRSPIKWLIRDRNPDSSAVLIGEGWWLSYADNPPPVEDVTSTSRAARRP